MCQVCSRLTGRIVVVLCALGAIATSYTPLAAQTDTTFTYQGVLNDGGQPASGSYDITVSLWDAVAGGNQVGSTVPFNGLSMTDGHFTIELDFGADAFDNNGRWLEITVVGTTLTPRQPITRAPYSIQTRGIVVNNAEHVGIGVNPGGARLRAWNFAGNALEAFSSSRAIEAITTEGDMAILASNQSADGMGVFAQHQPSQNQGWLGTPDYGVFGRALDVNNDWAGFFRGRAHVSDRLFVGRETPVSSFEYFGVNAPVTSGFGGMYVSTAGENAWPFYGYAAGGTGDCWHYYDGLNEEWNLVVKGEKRIVVDSKIFPQIQLLGRVLIGDRDPAITFSLDTSLHFVGLNYLHKTGFTSKMRFYNDKVIFEDTGNVGVGTFNPNYKLDVNGTAGKPGGGSWSNSSDRRLKKNIEDLDSALDQLLQLRGVTFEYKDPDAINELHGTRIGMIAQEVEDVFPDWVSEGGHGYKTLAFSGFEALTVEALRELREEKDLQIASLNNEVGSLRTLNESLENRLAQLEALVAQLATSEGDEQ